jgi:hypothetical protein
VASLTKTEIKTLQISGETVLKPSKMALRQHYVTKNRHLANLLICLFTAAFQKLFRVTLNFLKTV